MKLKTIFENIKSEAEILSEGLKFGRKQIQDVLKEKRDILVGIEYEFHINKEHIGETGYDEDRPSEEDIYDRAHELLSEYIDEQKEKARSDYAKSDFDEFDVGDITMNLRTIKEKYQEDIDEYTELFEAINNFSWERTEDGAFDKNDLDDVENFITILKSLLDEDIIASIKEIVSSANSIEFDEGLDRILFILPWDSTNISNNWESFVDAGDKFVSIFDEDKFEEQTIKKVLLSLEQGMTEQDDLFAPKYEEIVEEVSDILDEIEELPNVVYDFENILDETQKLKGNDNDWDKQIKKEFEEYADDYVESDDFVENLIGKHFEIYGSEFWGEAVSELGEPFPFDEDEELSERAQEFVTEVMSEDSSWSELYDSVDTIKTDGSVEQGVEVITKPEPIDQALDTMERMFEFIKEYGSTSTSTGMHVNMSFRGLSFNKDQFNPTKLVLLLDPKYLKTVYPVRGHYTAFIYDAIDEKVLFNIAGAKNVSEMIERFNEAAVPKSTKHQQINFSHISDSVNISRQRIEFRFFGGEDYERNFELNSMHIYRVAYTLMAAFSPTFGEKEYLKEMIRVLDEQSDKYFSRSFNEVVRYRKSNPQKDIQNFYNELNDLED